MTDSGTKGLQVWQPVAEYERRLKARRERIADFDRTHFRISNLRLLIAASVALLLWLAFGRATVSPWWPLAGAIVFGALVVVHARLLERAERARRAARLYERGIERFLSGASRYRLSKTERHLVQQRPTRAVSSNARRNVGREPRAVHSPDTRRHFGTSGRDWTLRVD